MQFVYFAVTLNMDTLFGNIYLNTMLAAMTEIPANIIVTCCLQKYGRKKCLLVLCCLIVIGGCVSLGLLTVDSEYRGHGMLSNITALGFIAIRKRIWH